MGELNSYEGDFFMYAYLSSKLLWPPNIPKSVKKVHELFYFTELERVGACKHLERPRKLLFEVKETY